MTVRSVIARCTAAALLGALAVIPSAAAPAAAAACSAPVVGDGILKPGKCIMPGDRVWSQQGAYFLIMQWDGNLVLYRNDGTPVWATATWNPGAGYWAVWTTGGQLIVYNQLTTRRIWDSGPWHAPRGSILKVQDDGKLMVYGPRLEPLAQACIDIEPHFC